MGRTKGSGALKLIDDQDAVEIRRILDAGGKPERDPKAQAAGKPERWLERAPNVELLIRWRSLVSQRDDCAKRIAAKDKTVTKWTHKTRKRLNREIEETWQQLGAELAKLEPQQLADALARLANAARAPAFPWQKRATELVAIAMLRDDGSSRLLPTKPRPNRELVEQRKVEQAGLTKKQRKARILKRNAAAQAHEQYLDTPEGRAWHEKWLVSRKAHGFPAPDAELYAGSGEDKTTKLKGKKVNITVTKLIAQLQAEGHKIDNPHEVRRFVRDTLQVTLKSEQGRRRDLR